MGKFGDWIDEMYTKKNIDTIGKHHADRAIKSNSDSKYHTVMRNRASRLRSLRDHSGPNAPQTKFKAGRQQMLKYAGEDSKTAKKLKEDEASFQSEFSHPHHPQHDLWQHAVPALKHDDGRIVRGKRGETHQSLLYKHTGPQDLDNWHAGYYHTKNKTFVSHGKESKYMDSTDLMTKVQRTRHGLKEEGHIHLTAYDKHHPSGTQKKSFVAKASSDEEVDRKLASIKNHVKQTGRTHRVLIHNTRTGEVSHRDIKHTNAFD